MRPFVNPTQYYGWKTQLLNSADVVFAGGKSKRDRDGVFKTRGFLGDYKVTVKGKSQVTVDTKLTLPGTEVVLKLH